MDEKITSQFAYLKEQYGEYKKYCYEIGKTGEVTHKIIGDAQNILLGLSRLPDVLMSEFYRQKLLPVHVQTGKKNYEGQVSYPAKAQTLQQLSEQLQRWGAEDIENSNPEFYEFVKGFMQSSTGEKLRKISDYAGRTHRVVLQQTITRESFTNIGGVVNISDHAGVQMQNVLINGMPVHSLTASNGKITGMIDPRLQIKRVIELRFLFEDSGENVFEVIDGGFDALDVLCQGFYSVLD